jgi:hydroxyethylthiazole kinase-like uncharacterized protein yjeF
MTSSTPHRLLSVAQLRVAEAAAASALPAGTLMQRAGRAAADALLARFAGPRRVLVLCGPGNNGGDGYETACGLAQAGWPVTCVALAAPATVDARAAAARWRASAGTVAMALPTDLDRADLVLDAMFGIGLARPLEGLFAEAATRLQPLRPRVVALDVPSGLNADTGAWVGGQPGVQAALTITFIADKPGLHTRHGRDAAGEIMIADLGVATADCVATLVQPSDFPLLLRSRAQDSHKGQHGNVCVVGGAPGMAGAALLAARAALRLGAGRVYAHLVGAPQLTLDPCQPELMLRPRDDLPAGVWVVGCGIGTDPAAAGWIDHALRHAQSLVVDADALNLLATDHALRKRFVSCAGSKVITPHPLEAARLLERSAADVQDDRLASATELAREMNAIAVLKGSGTVIADPQGLWINPTGSPALATAGTGDVLAGMIGAFMAQCDDPAQAVRAAVWLHGAAGEGDGDVGLVASDLAMRAATRWRMLRLSRSAG